MVWCQCWGHVSLCWHLVLQELCCHLARSAPSFGAHVIFHQVIPDTKGAQPARNVTHNQATISSSVHTLKSFVFSSADLCHRNFFCTPKLYMYYDISKVLMNEMPFLVLCVILYNFILISFCWKVVDCLTCIHVWAWWEERELGKNCKMIISNIFVKMTMIYANHSSDIVTQVQLLTRSDLYILIKDLYLDSSLCRSYCT